MKKGILLSVLIAALAVYSAGCKKNQEEVQLMQEPMSMETLSALSSDAKATVDSQAAESISQNAQTLAESSASSLEPLPPQGPYSPSVKEVQLALKNAGYYTGSVDGKIGPMTKKATEEFQKANNLKVDGKVGPMTWDALSKHLESMADAAVNP
jgi:peptidoglycan hydrolase-like protein with peptidoglycan-binding domain